MQLCKLKASSGDIRFGVLGESSVRLLQVSSLSEVLHAADPAAAAGARLDIRV